MPIEKEIKETIKRFTFNKKLFEFIKRANHLERKLKEGESLLVGVDEKGLSGPAHYTADFIYVELHIGTKRERVLTLDCLGDMTYRQDLFLPEYQRE